MCSPRSVCVVAGVALAQGALDLAREALDEASIAEARVSDQRIRWRVIERIAAYACRLGAGEAAVRLYAAAEQGRSRTHDLVDPAERDLRERDREALNALAPDAFVADGQAGEPLSLPRALELAGTVLAQTRPDER